MARVRAARGPAARAQVEHAHVVEPHVVEVLPADDDEPVRRHAREVCVARARGECVGLGLGLVGVCARRTRMDEAVQQIRGRRRRHGAEMRLSVRHVLRCDGVALLLLLAAIRREPAAAREVEEADVVEHAEVVCARGVRAVAHPAEHDEVVVPCGQWLESVDRALEECKKEKPGLVNECQSSNNDRPPE